MLQPRPPGGVGVEEGGIDVGELGDRIERQHAAAGLAHDPEGLGVTLPPGADEIRGLRCGFRRPRDREDGVLVGRTGGLDRHRARRGREEPIAHDGVVDQVEQVGRRPPERLGLRPVGLGGEVGRRPPPVAGEPLGIALGQPTRHGVPHDVVEDQPLGGRRGERQPGDLVEPVAHRVGCEQGAQDRLVDAADHRCRLHRLDRPRHQPGEERLGQLRHELGRRAVAQLQPARRPGRSGEGQRERVPAGEGVDARGLLLREPARAQQRERLRLVEALQLQAPHQVLPARVRDPAGPRGLAPGDEQQEAVGQVRQEVLAQPCVEQAEGLVGVDADDRARRGGRQAPRDRRHRRIGVLQAEGGAERAQNPRGVGSISRQSRRATGCPAAASSLSAAWRSRDLPIPPGPWTNATRKGGSSAAAAPTRVSSSSRRPTNERAARSLRRSATVFLTDINPRLRPPPIPYPRNSNRDPAPAPEPSRVSCRRTRRRPARRGARTLRLAGVSPPRRGPRAVCARRPRVGRRIRTRRRGSRRGGSGTRSPADRAARRWPPPCAR